MHDVYVVGVPLIAIIAGILLNRQDANRLQSALDGTNMRIDSTNTRIDALHTEMHQEFRKFYRTIGQHDVKIETLEKRQAG